MRPESSRHSSCLAIGSPLQFMWWPAEAAESSTPSSKLLLRAQP